MMANEHLRSLLLLLCLLVVAAGMTFLARQGRELFGLLALLALVGTMIICRWPTLGILIFLTTFFVRYPQMRVSPNNLLGLVFAGLLVLKTYQERELWFLKERALQVGFFLIVLFFISSYVAEQHYVNSVPEFDSTGEKLERLVMRFFFLLFFVSFIRTYRGIQLVFWSVVVMIGITAISAIPGPGNYRVVASMGIAAAGNPNWLAFFCEFAIALLWSYRQVAQRKWLWVLLTGAVGGLALVVLLTASRSGLINLFLLCALLTMQGRFSLKRQLQTALVVVLVGYLAIPLLSESHLERLGNILPGSSSSETKGAASGEKRLHTVLDGLKMIAREPLFGVGIGNFPWVHMQISESGLLAAPHNSYLWAAAEGGIPVLLLYLLLFWYTFKNFRQVEQEARHPELRMIASGLRIGLLVFLCFSFFAEFWFNIITYIMVGLAIVLRRLQEQERLVNLPGAATRVEGQMVPA